ncbi:MAG: formylglycine-generating enzyme family protein [Acidobacteria bacterium]|nr:formylglycine-generating enzyme family protein [Acidobacteriota bacterium]
MKKLINFSFSLIFVSLLISILPTNTYGQKGLDGEETSQPKKTPPKKPVGKGFDDSATTNSKTKTAGKSLDDEATIVSKPERVEIKPKIETVIRVNPTPEKAPPSARKEKDRRVEKPAEPAKPQQETDVGSDYPEMVIIPSGTFMMGSKEGQENENPVHEVFLSSFEISKHEITNHQFRNFIKATKYKTTAEEDSSAQIWTSYAIFGRARYPVVYITYADALAYCKWLSSTTKQTYRLPSEAEWEYAARGGTKDQPYPWGKNIEISYANYAPDDSRKAYGEPILDYLKPVGSYEPNGFGIYDVIGNVAEWCFDGFKSDYYKESPKENPICPDQGNARVVRGGGWMNTTSFFSLSFRKNHPGAYKSSSLGFRVVRVIKVTENSPVASSKENQTKETSSNNQTKETKETKDAKETKVSNQ